jgi:hypothetical protein
MPTVHERHKRKGKLSERERLHSLKVFDELAPRIPARPKSEVAKEMRGIRKARRAGGRASVRRSP